mgnify:CR=1 FL=1
MTNRHGRRRRQKRHKRRARDRRLFREIDRAIDRIHELSAKSKHGSWIVSPLPTKRRRRGYASISIEDTKP